MCTDLGPVNPGLLGLQSLIQPPGGARRPASPPGVSTKTRLCAARWMLGPASHSLGLSVVYAVSRPTAASSRAGRADPAVPRSPAAPPWAGPRREPQIRVSEWAAVARPVSGGPRDRSSRRWSPMRARSPPHACPPRTPSLLPRPDPSSHALLTPAPPGGAAGLAPQGLCSDTSSRKPSLNHNSGPRVLVQQYPGLACHSSYFCKGLPLFRSALQHHLPRLSPLSEPVSDSLGVLGSWHRTRFLRSAQ